MPRRKALKVIVDIHFHAITCPGVFLPDQQDVFLNVEVLGQRKRTASIPPVFPFLFHEKLRFEKVFSHATDPVQVATALSGERAIIELVQLTYPAGELLATYEDNARDFLFPTPRISPTYPGVDREILLQRSSAFGGIAPKLEFSSRTVIKEVTSVGGSSHLKKRRTKAYSLDDKTYEHPDSYRRFNNAPVEASTPQVPATNRTASKKKHKTSAGATPAPAPRRSGRTKGRSASLSRAIGQRGYEASTIASRARSPSPYTRRRMAQLSVRDPFDSTVEEKPFKSVLEERPQFVVRKAEEDGLSPLRVPPPLPPVSPSGQRSKNRTPSPRNYSHSPGRRKPTPGKYLSLNTYGRSRDADSEDSDSSDDVKDQLNSSALDKSSYLCSAEYRNFHAWRKHSALKSAYYRPITSGCCSRMPLNRDELDNSELESFLRNKDWREDLNLSRTLSGIRDQCALSPCVIRNEPCRSLSVGKECQKANHKKRGRVRFRSTTELIDSSLMHPCSRPSSARSAPESARTPRRDSDFNYDEPSTSSASKLTPSSILFRTPLRERFSSCEPSPYEKIRDRVRDLLQSPRATRIIDESMAEANERYRMRRSRSPSPRSSPRSTSVNVRLGENDYWNERASEYSGRSHRRVFEDNIEKIYDDIYRSVKRSTD